MKGCERRDVNELPHSRDPSVDRIPERMGEPNGCLKTSSSIRKTRIRGADEEILESLRIVSRPEGKHPVPSPGPVPTNLKWMVLVVLNLEPGTE